ncbi:MAG: hypothetical protein AAGI30_02880 [Planctomycetota bacterium]
MSWRAIFVFAVIVILAGGAWVGVTWWGKAASTPGRTTGQIVEVEPSDVVALRLELPDETAPLEYSRSEEAGWVELLADGVPWPVASGRVDRLLRQVHSVGVDPTITGRPRDPIVATLTDRAGAQHIARIGTAPIGGRVIVRSGDGASGTTTTDLLDAVTRPSPRSWRDGRAMPNISPGRDARVSIDVAGHRLELARVGRAWTLRAPAVARADESAVSQLFARLGGLRIDEFDLSDSPRTRTERAAHGLAEPIARVVIERDDRVASGNGEVGTVTHETHLTIGATTNDGAVWADPGLGGHLLLRLNGTSGLELAQDAVGTVEQYLARTALGVPPADIAEILLDPTGTESRTFTRDLSRWREPISEQAESAQEPAPLPSEEERQGERNSGTQTDSDAEAEAGPPATPEPPQPLDRTREINRLLRFLTSVEAEPSLHRDHAPRVLATLTLIGRAGEPASTLGVHTAPNGQLVLADASVMWTYGLEATTLPVLLAELLADPQPPEPPATGQAGTDTPVK